MFTKLKSILSSKPKVTLLTEYETIYQDKLSLYYEGLAWVNTNYTGNVRHIGILNQIEANIISDLGPGKHVVCNRFLGYYFFIDNPDALCKLIPDYKNLDIFLETKVDLFTEKYSNLKFLNGVSEVIKQLTFNQLKPKL